MQSINRFAYSLIMIQMLMQPMVYTKTPSHTTNPAPAIAEWSFLTYIAADNSLASFASYNINDMSKGVASVNNSNILVQWDKPSDKKSWRYKIKPGGKTDIGTVSSEMGYRPSQELVAAVQWMVTNYPARHYAIVLWNHGSGVEDFSPGSTRGILYDDSQQTCLTNQGLVDALASIKQIIGQNLDIIAMDACLMAMVEVAYEMKDSVNLFVGSEETIPGNGFPYSQFLKPLTTNPLGTTPLILAKNMVSTYQQYYTYTQPTSDLTLSVIDLASIDQLKQNIDQFIDAVNACAAINAVTTKKIILAARKSTTSFEMHEYIDLYSFYANILGKVQKANKKSEHILQQIQKDRDSRVSSNPDYQVALNNLKTVVSNGLTQITTTVLKSASGPTYSGVKGISIYYPTSGSIHSSYLLTPFAHNTAWVQFIQAYQS